MAEEKATLAVIGSGIAGLSAAWLLKQKYKVTLIEGHERAGMGVHTIDYHSQGKHSRIDVPLRIFTEGYYHNLLALYKQIGVSIESSDHSGIFANSQGQTLFHYGRIKMFGRSFSFPKGRSIFSLSAWQLVLANQRFFNNAYKAMHSQQDLSTITFAEYLQQSGTEQKYIDIILLPILAVTCTCDYQSILNYPADIMLGYLTCGIWKFGILNAEKGVDDIVPRLLENIELQTGSKVTSIAQVSQQVQHQTLDKIKVVKESGEAQYFDQVVIASQAQQAAAMLDGFDQQKQLLSTVPFESSWMTVHTDHSILPQDHNHHSPVSYILPDNAQRPQVSVDLSKAISRYQQQGQVFQTWNPVQPLAKDKLLAKVEFTRPVVNHESRAALQKLKNLQFQAGNNLWFCGSYMANKIPLLDAAVDSSVAIAEYMDIEIPWKKHG